MNKKKKENCSCQCHFQNPLFYHLDCCCCPFFCYPHESSPNIISDKFNSLESPRIIIPHKEKEFCIKSEQRTPMSKLSEEFKSRIPFFCNKINNIFPNKSNLEENNLQNIDNNINNNGKKIKNIENKKNILFKKIKVNKYNKQRILTIETNNSSSNKNTIDINNYFPNSVKRSKKAKQINNYDFDRNKKILVNKKLNLTNISPKYQDPGIIFNSIIGNKFSKEDRSDDIMNQNQNKYSIETNDNRKILQNLKKEIDKTKCMIFNLKSENKKLKNELNKKEKNDIKAKQDEITENNTATDNKEITLEKEVNYLKNELKEITNKFKEYENMISLLKKRNNEQEAIIENKNKEILNLVIKLGNYENQLNKNIQDTMNKNTNDNLKKEIIELKQIIENKDNKIKETEIKLKFEKNFNNKKQKMLELLFNFYQNLKKVINYEAPKESLKHIIDIITIDDFEIKLNKFEKKIIQIIEDIQIKHGHCFACDIACCTSSVDKLKSFRKKVIKNK